MTAEIRQRNARQKEKGHARNKKLFGRIGLAESDKRDGDIAVSEDENVFGRRVEDEGATFYLDGCNIEAFGNELEEGDFDLEDLEDPESREDLDDKETEEI